MPLQKEIIEKAESVLRLERKNIHVAFSNLINFRKELLDNLWYLNYFVNCYNSSFIKIKFRICLVVDHQNVPKSNFTFVKRVGTTKHYYTNSLKEYKLKFNFVFYDVWFCFA